MKLIAPCLALATFLMGTPPTELFAQVPGAVTETAFRLDGGGEMRYAISLPDGYESSEQTARPLILALHPGGRSEYYGSWFLQSIVEPALRDWGAVIVAPDVPARNWASADSEEAVMALVNEVLATHSIDRARVLVTGFSMGGAGTWYMATRHAELFTGAIAVAGRRGDDPLDGLGSMPVHIIHSPEDEVVPYDQAEETAESLEDRGHRVHLTSLPGASHYMMGDYVAPIRAAGDWMIEQWEADDAQGGR